LALNRLWDLNLPLARLEAIGLQLGADVPFFLRGHNAWVEGIGEKITPVQLPSAQVIVARPSQGIDTKSIFVAPDLERATTPAIISGFAACSAQDEQQMFSFGRNDLQPVAQRLCPEVTQAIEWLGAKGLQARMTGSGSAVFAPWVQNAQAANLQEADLSDAPQGWAVRQCRNMSVHPLAGWADSDNS
jgi:4-diphosphocytidyl-2-C-methyl-D-erythritol kinase